MAATPAQISAAARRAANLSWAQTPVWADRTAAARAASPVSLSYWIAKITADGIVCEQDIEKAARKAYSVYMAELAAKGVRKRQANKAASRAA